MCSHFKTFEKMIEKIQNSNLNECVITYKDNFVRVSYDYEKYIVHLDNIIFYGLTIEKVKELTNFLKNEKINEIKLEGFITLDNIYGYPELFSIKVI